MTSPTITPDPRQPGIDRQRPRHAFSLIELMVVMAVIALLAGISFVAARSMMAQGAVEQTRVVLQAAAGVPTEMLAVTDRPMQYRDIPSEFTALAYPSDPVDPTAPAAWNSINFLVRYGQGIPAAKAMLQGIDRNFFKYVGNTSDDADDPEKQYIVDAWGQPLRFSQFGNSGTANDPSDDFYGGATQVDGTGTYDEKYGMPKRRTPYVASAGPDGLWGEFDAAGLVPNAAAADNLYSFELP